MSYRFISNLFVVASVFLLAACASNRMYRDNYELCVYKKPGDCVHNALQAYAPQTDEEYHLGFVEYDDQGQLRDRKQMQAVLDEYYKIAGSDDDILLVTFVHGWHHSAQPGDANIGSFRDMLIAVSKMENVASKQQGRNKRKILGLYVGWRGESITVPYVNEITFWDRKNTAHDVGQQGVTEVLLKLEEIVNVKTGFEEDIPPPVKSRLVVIGHSFGGAVVYTSLQKVLADRFIDSRRGKTHRGDAEGFGDLVVLINPAFEALRFSTLYDISQEGCRRYLNSQLPKLAILTSEADYATKYAFPAGRFVSTTFESYATLDRYYCNKPGTEGMQIMKVSEGKADRNTVGHYKPYITHRLEPSSQRTERGKGYQIKQIQDEWAGQENTGTLEFSGTKLVHYGRTSTLNPYLNIQVDESLISDHNDIWQPEIVEFIRDLIVISTTPPEVGR